MNEDITILNNKFKNIKALGWVEGISNGTGNAGRTLEFLLSKELENFEIPDFNGIEIKTKNVFSNAYINLFNATPDEKYLFEIKRLTSKYGYPDKVYKTANLLQVSLFCNKISDAGYRYKFKGTINKLEHKIFLNVFNRYSKIIDTETYWSFQLLKEKLERKLKYLALIDVLVNYHNNKQYFLYNNIYFYELKDFDNFLNLLENGKIRITFKVGVFKSGVKSGQMHDHGTGFGIKEKDLELLYNKINI